MASVINTNTLSMVTQQNLNQSQNALNTSMERLSSGMRINSAKDDAAGQAIANRMDSQITGLSQAQRNANDGISVAQTAEGALNQVNDNLQRVRELTVQAQNGTNNADDLSSIQDEITMRLDEINRISEQTSFNGVEVLNTNDSLSIQVGANDGEVIEINLSTINSETLNLSTFNIQQKETASLGNAKTSFSPSVASISNETGSTTFSRDVDLEITNVTNKPSGESGTLEGFIVDDNDETFAIYNTSGSLAAYKVEASNVNTATGDIDLSSATAESALPKTGTSDVAAGEATDNVSFTETITFDNSGFTPATGESIDSTDPVVTDGANYYVKSQDADGNDSYTKIDLDTVADDGTYTLDANADTPTTIKDSAGNTVSGTLHQVQDDEGNDTGTYVVKDGDNTYAVESVDTDTGEVIVKEASYTDANGDTQNTKVMYGGVDGQTEYAVIDDKSYGIADDGSVDIDSGEIALDPTSDPLKALDDALKQVDGMRSDLGAVQNRFDSAITNLATTETNLASAQSRIQDADYAEEVSSMTTAQILQQAGTSMLTQANQVPQNVLSLLG